MFKKSRFMLGFMVSIMLGLLWSITVFAASPPTGISQDNSSEDSISVQWSGHYSLSYEYRLSEDNKNWGVVEKSAIEYVHLSGLRSGTTYYMQIRSYTSGKTDYSSWVTAKVTTSPERVKESTIVQTKATNNSVSFEWAAVSGATGYEIYFWNGSYKLIGTASSASFTQSGLGAGDEYSYQILPIRVEGSYRAEANLGFNYFTAKTTAKLQTVTTGGSYKYINKYALSWSRPTRCDGFEVTLYNHKGKKISSNDVGYLTSYYTFNNIKSTSFYSAKVRSYVKLKTGKAYGKEATIVFANQVSATVKRSKKGLSVKWKKVQGATGYTVYVSTKRDTGYKKAGTTKKLNFAVKKYGKKKLKKGKTYYVYVVSNKKVGKKTWKSYTSECYYLRY